MCLFTKPKSSKIAKKDILLFKTVLVDRRNPGKWYGYYYSGKKFPFDETIDEGGKNETEIERTLDNFLCVGEGFLHSTDSEKIAQNICKYATFEFKDSEYIDAFVCRCTIPEGAVYYTDKYCMGYASDKLIVHNPFGKGKED